MVFIIHNNAELTKLIINEKDKVKLKYKQKLNNIKQHYGVEFDVEHLKNDSVKSINFINLNYKNGFNNLCVTYDNLSKKMDYISYEFTDSRVVKNTKHKKIVPYLEKEYKLNLIVAEVNRLNEEYLREINEIDNTYKNTPINNAESGRILQVNKNEENS